MKNVRAYFAFIVLTRAYFWYAVFFLYFESKFSIAQVLWLESIYYASVVLLEIPSGYFSDKFGRVAALRVSAAGWTVAYATFFFADQFWVFAIAQILFASGFAFSSGSDTSFLYGALAEAGREDEFLQYEAKVGALGSAASAVSVLSGAALATWQLSYGHLASAVASAIALIVALILFREPPRQSDDAPLQFRDTLDAIAQKLRASDLRWLFAASVSTTVLVHVPYEYYQPYVSRLDVVTTGTWAPSLVTGFHATASLIFAALFTGLFAVWSGRTNHGVPVAKVVLLGLSGLVAMSVAMSSTEALWVAALITLRSVPGGLIKPLLNSAIVPLVDDHIRATYLSVDSLAGRLAFALLIAILAAVGTETDGSLSVMLQFASGVGVLLVVGLAISSRVVHRVQAKPQPSE